MLQYTHHSIEKGNDNKKKHLKRYVDHGTLLNV